jgi:hypothetical protein
MYKCVQELFFQAGLDRTKIHDVASFHRLSVYDLCRLNVALNGCMRLFATDGVGQGARWTPPRMRCFRSAKY